jgi:biopolymer transport protein ExbB
MSKLTLITAVAALAVVSTAAAQTLDELARMVREAATSDAGINQEREDTFVRERNNQQTLLAKAREELAGENARSDRLRDEYDLNERALAELETTLAERMGNLGELFGVVRQSSGDIQAVLEFHGDRAVPGAHNSFPTWHGGAGWCRTACFGSAMVTGIALSGKVVKFVAPVERTTGQKKTWKSSGRRIQCHWAEHSWTGISAEPRTPDRTGPPTS